VDHPSLTLNDRATKLVQPMAVMAIASYLSRITLTNIMTPPCRSLVLIAADQSVKPRS
jgi:hypothetical protein